MKIVTTVRAGLVAALIAVGMLAGAGPSNAEKVCIAQFVLSKPTIGVGSIIATVKATCDVPPQEHEMRLSLNMFVRGEGWETQKIDSFDEIPHPTAVYQVKTACVPGTWRMQAEAVGSLNGKPFNYAINSMETFVTAEQCARGRN